MNKFTLFIIFFYAQVSYTQNDFPEEVRDDILKYFNEGFDKNKKKLDEINFPVNFNSSKVKDYCLKSLKHMQKKIPPVDGKNKELADHIYKLGEKCSGFSLKISSWGPQRIVNFYLSQKKLNPKHHEPIFFRLIPKHLDELLTNYYEFFYDELEKEDNFLHKKVNNQVDCNRNEFMESDFFMNIKGIQDKLADSFNSDSLSGNKLREWMNRNHIVDPREVNELLSSQHTIVLDEKYNALKNAYLALKEFLE